MIGPSLIRTVLRLEYRKSIENTQNIYDNNESRQIEMDERFWTASSLITLFHDDICQENFARLPPEAIALLED
jgi:hypothetical protein